MKSPVCDMLAVEFPLFAFSHTRDVVVEVTKAGGFGVLGAVGHTPESLEIELSWIDEHIDGKPYGIDLLVPTSLADKEKMLTANSRQTVRSRSRTGKYTRQLRSPWTDSWQDEDAPDALPMPLQGVVSSPPLRLIDRLAETGHAGAKKLATYFVGQGVGLMNTPTSARTVVFDFMEDFATAVEHLGGILDE